jgi:hypothetical protein
MEDDLDDDDGDGGDDATKKPLTTTFELNDTLWAEATLEESETVYLWLGVSLIVSSWNKSLTEFLRIGKRYAIIYSG